MSQQHSIKWENYVNLGHKIARRVYARLCRAGFTVEYDDVFQETALTFIKARDAYNPERGVKFSTYFYRAAMINLNNWSQNVMRDQATESSLDAQLDADRGGDTFLDRLIDGQQQSPEDQLMEAQKRKEVLSQMRPVTRLVVRALENPPPALRREMQALKAKAQITRQSGVRRPAREQLTLGMLMKVMGLTSAEVAIVRKDLARAAN